jgi:predicted Fe-Mo cluster-binding NifX family protein
MKIAIPAQAGYLEARIDMRFGRAKCFVVVDPETWDFEIVDNKQNIQASAGAGIQAAQIVADHGADVLIAGNCGPKAFTALKAADIKVFMGLDGTVREAVKSYKDGNLKLAEGANVEAHSGI